MFLMGVLMKLTLRKIKNDRAQLNHDPGVELGHWLDNIDWLIEQAEKVLCQHCSGTGTFWSGEKMLECPSCFGAGKEHIA